MDLTTALLVWNWTFKITQECLSLLRFFDQNPRLTVLDA